MSDNRNGPRKGGTVEDFKDAVRDAWSSGPFAFVVFLLFAVVPLLGLAYLFVRAILGLFGVELPAFRGSVQ